MLPEHRAVGHPYGEGKIPREGMLVFAKALYKTGCTAVSRA